MKYQFMPMFWGDFFANTLHLSAQELGAYVALIGHAWEHDGKIAVADLQRVARVNSYHWPKVRSRIAQFFSTSEVLNFWHHGRVHAELTKAAELSNKRKAAAMQMHSKSKANAAIVHPHLHYKLEINNLGKGSEGPTEQPPEPNLPPVVDYRDPGIAYRSPPARKAEHPPLTDEQRTAAMLLAAKDKPAPDRRRRKAVIEEGT